MLVNLRNEEIFEIVGQIVDTVKVYLNEVGEWSKATPYLHTSFLAGDSVTSNFTH